MFRLDKKIAFVTGAGSGIGEQIARLFAQQGAHVVLADIRPDAAERVAGDIKERSWVCPHRSHGARWARQACR